MGESKVGYLFAKTYSLIPVHRMTFIREISHYKSLHYHMKLWSDIVCLLSLLLKGQTNMPFSILHSASRFHEHWRFVLQRLAFLAAFVVYLESESLVTRDEVAQILGIEVVREKGFHLDVEDYLAGVLIMASELSRLAVNSVTAGDYSRPLRISNFINELDSGFRLLNLKNDPLRKRYDGLKYDVKKIEEVVYDLSIRGLAKEQEAGGDK
uniref:Translin n=1 Tax=Hucho hucho TaxID=62062 RepID=A0A4W5JSS1_9TELE